MNRIISFTFSALFLSILLWAPMTSIAQTGKKIEKAAILVLKPQILKEAAWAMKQDPVTVTAAHSPRSAGGLHDFFSEGDYWWPDPANPDGPYIQKDGMTNPDNFVAHRHAMIRFSQIVGALAAAYKITGEDKYVRQALLHVKAWFIDSATYMHPNLLYSQAITGRFTGRGIGIIDAIQLMEVAQGMAVMSGSKAMDRQILSGAKTWFSQYLQWVTTHPYGLAEMNATNNHGTCWAMQVACFAKFVGDQKLMDFCRSRFKTVFLPKQMGEDGGFPRELGRTKPYGYSIFNLDAMTTLCQILSVPKDASKDLWNYSVSGHRNMHLGVNFLFPYLKNKSSWPYKQDVMHWNDWPVAQPSLLFAAVAYADMRYFDLWKRLDHAPKDPEVIRNLPIRHPLIWL
ncbi:MAG TPA: alginate lyase family protein [Arachidicoccus sp.]|nr:alginate lyase family protein [Arachidicoccus sp.]